MSTLPVPGTYSTMDVMHLLIGLMISNIRMSAVSLYHYHSTRGVVAFRPNPNLVDAVHEACVTSAAAS